VLVLSVEQQRDGGPAYHTLRLVPDLPSLRYLPKGSEGLFVVTLLWVEYHTADGDPLHVPIRSKLNTVL
jgi:hypothetical protein